MKLKRYSVVIVLVLCFLGCDDDEVRVPLPPANIDLSDSFSYTINLNDRSHDTFKVRLFVDNLTDANRNFQFAATAPGTYSIADIGRFVRSFKAFDEKYHSLGAEQISTNQWALSDPENTRIIEYEIAETFDTPVNTNPILLMGGSSIENDHALINTFDVLGYPTGLKERDFYLTVEHPSGWTVGTSLPLNSNGQFVATDYDFLADNPLLLGEITSASLSVGGSDVKVYTYSKNDVTNASLILDDLDQILLDAEAFLNGLPVDHYNFLYYFDEFARDDGVGALEHSYSSVHVLWEIQFTQSYRQTIKDIAAHEFFHIVTPLNIHSEIIEDFNFATPTPSEHLWLYEGVTEWASMLMQYRNNSINLNLLLAKFSSKLSNMKAYDENFSLSEIALECYTDTGAEQYGNIYQKGAMVAALLDIRLLELSVGERGLREVILELVETYGPEHAFSEETFFNDLTAMTYPEIGDFLDRYVRGTEELPVADYFWKLGIEYDVTTNTFKVLHPRTELQSLLFSSWSMNL